MNRNFYIAYGSNLNIDQMAYRCPDAIPVGTAVLEGWQLLFRGRRGYSYLTIEDNEKSEVPVAIWEVSAEDEKRLDYYEGFPTTYRKDRMKVLITDGELKGKTVSAFVYIMNEKTPTGLPSRYYIDTCAEGYRDFGFDMKYLAQAIKYTKEKQVCPICGKPYLGYPAISRKDNKTPICSGCGMREALNAMADYRESKKN